MTEYTAWLTSNETYTLTQDGEVVFDNLSQPALFEQLSYEMMVGDTFKLVDE